MQFRDTKHNSPNPNPDTPNETRPNIFVFPPHLLSTQTMATRVIVYGRSFTIFQLINRPPISTQYQLFFTPNLHDLHPNRVNSDIVLVGGAVADSERNEIVKRFDGSNVAVALMPKTALKDWGKDKVVDGIFGLLNASQKYKAPTQSSG
jgi:hypothetical protein